MRTNIYISAIALGLIGLFLGGWIFIHRDSTQLQEGSRQYFPDFTLLSLQGEQFTPTNFRGEVTLVRFMSTTCPYCEAEAPTLSKLSQDENFAAQFVDIDIAESAEVVRAYVEKHGITYPVLLDDGAVSVINRVTGTPTHITLRKDGSICDRHSGEMSEGDFREVVARCSI